MEYLLRMITFNTGINASLMLAYFVVTAVVTAVIIGEEVFYLRDEGYLKPWENKNNRNQKKNLKTLKRYNGGKNGRY